MTTYRKAKRVYKARITNRFTGEVMASSSAIHESWAIDTIVAEIHTILANWVIADNKAIDALQEACRRRDPWDIHDTFLVSELSSLYTLEIN